MSLGLLTDVRAKKLESVSYQITRMVKRSNMARPYLRISDQGICKVIAEERTHIPIGACRETSPLCAFSSGMICTRHAVTRTEFVCVAFSES